MMHEFCPSPVVSTVLGDLPENFTEAKNRIISKVRGLIRTGNIILEEGKGNFFLKRWEYDFVKNCYIRGPEYSELKITTKNGEISIQIKDEWCQSPLKTLFEAITPEAGK